MDFLSRLFKQPVINQLEPAEVNTMAGQSPRPILLDVRTPQEYKQGHIKGAELIPLDQLAQQLKRISKEREIICICQSGSRSISAARHLISQGYTASNMRGGISRWARAGLPLKTGMGK